MTKYKILISDGLAENGIEILSQSAEVSNNNALSPQDLISEIAEFDAIIIRGKTIISPEVVEKASKLKVIGRAGVGVDNIDLAAVQEKSITVVNAPSGSTTAVAELTIGLMISLMRHISLADTDMKSGKWSKNKLVGVELSGKTLGIIGVGRIGSAVAQRAQAFGMKVYGYDSQADDDEVLKRGATPVSLSELYAKADVISLHMPLTSETRGLINGQTFASMKRGAYIVCAARGGVIDELALHASLESGQIAGAALDVFAKEPPGLTALVAHPKVVATPHIGAFTMEAQARAAEHIANEVLAALNGEPLTSKIV